MYIFIIKYQSFGFYFIFACTHKIKSTYYLFSREDHLLICWHLEGGIAHSTVVTEFPNDFYPTDMQWHPRPNTASGTKTSTLDVLLITTADGMLFIYC